MFRFIMSTLIAGSLLAHAPAVAQNAPVEKLPDYEQIFSKDLYQLAPQTVLISWKENNRSDTNQDLQQRTISFKDSTMTITTRRYRPGKPVAQTNKTKRFNRFDSQEMSLFKLAGSFNNPQRALYNPNPLIY